MYYVDTKFSIKFIIINNINIPVVSFTVLDEKYYFEISLFLIVYRVYFIIHFLMLYIGFIYT